MAFSIRPADRLSVKQRWVGEKSACITNRRLINIRRRYSETDSLICPIEIVGEKGEEEKAFTLDGCWQTDIRDVPYFSMGGRR